VHLGGIQAGYIKIGKKRFIQTPRQRAARFLDALRQSVFSSAMNAMLSADGQIVIPREIRDRAHLQPGDTLEVQLYKGTLVLRKHQPLSPEQAAALLERSRSQPQPTPEDDAAVEQAIGEVRARRR